MMYLIENSVTNGQNPLYLSNDSIVVKFAFRASDVNLGMTEQKSPFHFWTEENACLLTSHHHREFQRVREQEKSQRGI